MKILVTGSTGFIGGMLCRELCSRGHEVRAFHRPSSTLRLLENLPVEHVLGDLTQPDTVQAAMLGVDVVFHTAASLGRNEQTGRMYAVTVEGTRSVVRAALQSSVRRLVYTSSVAALGVPEIGLKYALPLNENHAWNFRPDYWPYGYAKYLAELEVQKAVAMGLDAVIVNPAIVMGPGDIYRQASSLIVQMAHHRLPALVEGGSNIVHVDDVTAGHLAALERGRCGERYILGGENLTHFQLTHKISEVVGGSLPALMLPAGVARRLTAPMRWFAPFLNLPISYRSLNLAGYHFYYDTAKAQVDLNLDPPLPASRAIADAYAWFVEVGAIAKGENKDR